MNLADWIRKTHPFPDQLDVIEGVSQAVDDAIRKEEGMLSPEPSRIEVASDHSVRMRPPSGTGPNSPYTAPEIREGRPPRPNADVFSAGVIFYEILAGRHPFMGENPKAELEGALQPPPLRDLRPELPRDLTDAITACLERDPEWRPSDLGYLLQVVRSLKGPKAKPAPPPKARPPVVRPEPRRSEPRSAEAKRPAPSRTPV
ncbi:MAG TPA: protein kinase, partial [Vicinamibacteria bacterium]|nr:protein kinase [Vicinamibacteria bacterium]